MEHQEIGGVFFYVGDEEGSAHIVLVQRDGEWFLAEWTNIAGNVSDDDDYVIEDAG